MNDNKNFADLENEQRHHLNQQTAKIAWQELQRFYAQGNVLIADKTLDLILVAATLANDDANQLQQWLTDGLVAKVNDQQAQFFNNSNALLWAVVVAPWVLVQELKIDNSLDKQQAQQQQ